MEYDMKKFRRDLAWTIRDIRRQYQSSKDIDPERVKLFYLGTRSMFMITMGVLREAKKK